MTDDFVKFLSKKFCVSPGTTKKLLLETAIEMYQESGSQEDFDLIHAIYQPDKYIPRWYGTYGHLFDSEADFRGEFGLCFVMACKKFEQRRSDEADNSESGKRNFNNYFWGILFKAFVGGIKYRTCKKRNPPSKCPICEQMVSPLSSHILKQHQDLADKLITGHANVNGVFEGCPLCPAYVKEKTKDFTEVELRQHICSKHSSAVFSVFMGIHPEYDMAITDPNPPISSIMSANDEQGSGNDAMERVGARPVSPRSEDCGRLEMISILADDCSLTPCQRSLVDHFLFDDDAGLKIPSLKSLCKICLWSRNCSSCPRGKTISKETFSNELADLRRKIVSVLDLRTDTDFEISGIPH